MDGLEVLRGLKALDPDSGVIVTSAVVEGRTRLAIEALRGGAADYFVKPVEDLAYLEQAVAREVARRSARRAEQKQILELEHLARTDPLTGLANRLELEQRLREEFSRLERGADEFAVALFDIDSFKSFNDTHGHLVGDEVLIAVARAVRDNCRVYDVKARYGGDEFVVIMPDANLNQGVAVAEKIRRAVAARPISSGGRAISVTLSAGVTTTGPREGITSEGLIRRADLALYEAKKTGRNQIFSIGQGEPAAEVLLIGDDDTEGETIMRMCEILGCRADWTRTGSAGIERAKLSRYTLALVEIDLPDLAGTETVSRIREVSPATATALVADDDAASALVLEARADFPVAVTRKPISIDQLKTLLSEARRRT